MIEVVSPMKRISSIKLVLNYLKLIKNLLIPTLVLFVLNDTSTNRIWHLFWIAYPFILILMFLYIFLSWFTYRYGYDESAFYIHSGIFTKNKQVIPFNRIQNIQRKRKIIHKLFRKTHIVFSTASATDEDVIFDMLSLQEANLLEDLVFNKKNSDAPLDGYREESVSTHQSIQRIHYQATITELLKASFASVKFLLVVPTFAIGIMIKDKDAYQFVKKTVSIDLIMAYLWIDIIVLVGILIVSLVLSICYTLSRYWNYTLSSDDTKIYIKRGLFSESQFSIQKSRVQALNIKQGLFKQILGLVEVELVTSSNYEDDDEISTLYPFLPKRKAYHIITEVLPEYEIDLNPRKLDKHVLWLKLCRASIICIILSIALFIWIPKFWWLSLILLLTLVTITYVDFRNSHFSIQKEFIQMQSGGFVRKMLISKRKNIIEAKVRTSPIQRTFKASTIYVSNRANPVEVTTISDMPLVYSADFYVWYKKRGENIQVE
ncbi:PH domain-containing protein [Rummeliibacillus pycnus]|uniref:PH domain-containing protein n=1 Tax=Rummeliibacillus pycnus TaxID=101070 RepID=UPI0037C8363A